MRRFRAPVLTVFVILAAAGPMRAQRSTPVPAPSRLQLTVDSIMRGPDLVGAPPSEPALVGRLASGCISRGASPARTENALYVVGRDGGTPKRLSDEDAQGRAAVQRAMGHGPAAAAGDRRGDVIIHDGGAGDPDVRDPDDRRRVEPALGAERHPRHLRPRRQPLHRPGAGGSGVARHAAHRRRGREEPSHASPTARSSCATRKRS